MRQLDYVPALPHWAKPGRKTAVALSSALLFSVIFQVNLSHAATFTVNSTLDAVDAAPGNGICATATGVCTLRAAIQETNALPGADTIVLPAGIYVLTLPGADEGGSATGDLDIRDALTITGAGPGTTIVDGNGSVTGDRVLQIASGAGPVAISSVTIRGGAAPSTENGGGISNTGNLTLTNVTVTQNSAGVSGDVNGANGGGVSNNNTPGVTLALMNSTVSNNTARNGGGVRSGQAAVTTITNATLSGNTARNGGGGLFADGPATVSNSSFTNNTALQDGGGIRNQNVATLIGTTVSGNGAGGIGGGLRNTGTASISNSSITSNTAGTNGGGLWNSGTATLASSTVSENTGTNGTGGIFNFNPGTLTLNATTVSRNQATGPFGLGGGITNVWTLNVNDSSIRDNRALFGGGINNSSGTATVNRSSITGNTAQGSGGGIGSSGTSATLEVNDSTVQGNSSQNGGGIFLVGSTGIVRRSTISDNTAPFGGGIGTTVILPPGGSPQGSTLTIERSLLSGNRATGFGLGGAVANLGGTLTLTNSTLSGNTAANGGGLSNSNPGTPTGSARITNSTFSGNSTTSGGAVFNQAGSTASLLNTIVANSPSGNSCAGVITSNGHNLSSDGSCGFAGPGDMNSTNPILGPLANNGGPTQTHALLAGSPAIDAGSNVGCPVTDQRGVTRPLDGNEDGSVICDIGAYEVQPAPTVKNRPASVVGSGTTESALGPMDFSVSVSRAATGGLITGSLSKTLRSNGRGLRSTEITELVVISANHVIVEGRCAEIPSGEPCTFRANIFDFGAGGTKDSFLISTNDGGELGGRLISGDITIRLAP